MAPKALIGDTPPTAATTAADNDATERIKQIWEWMMTARDPIYFDSCLRDHVWFTSARIDPADQNHGFATFGMKVPLSLCNAGGNLHGGAVSLIFDMCTSMALSAIAREGFWDTGHVTRSLNCIYMRPAAEGVELIIENEVVHVGKTMAQLKGVMRRKDDGKICYTCEHGKVKVDNFKMHVPKEESKI